MTITIIDYNRSITLLSILYIHAAPNDNNKEKGDDDQEKEKKITKEEQDQTKDKEKEKKITKEEQDETKDKDKDIENSNKNDNSDFDQFDPAYRSFFPIKRIVIPEVYETIPNGQTYRFNINNPNDKVQVDKKIKKTFLQNKILMEVGE